MSRRQFDTPAGQIVLTGDFSGQRPLLLVIRGAYANEDQLSRLPNHVAASVVFGDIPGNRSPWLAGQTIQRAAEAYSSALRTLDRPAAICGVSLGGLIALGIRGPQIRGILAIDPPLRPAETAYMRRGAASAFARAEDDDERAFLYAAFGARAEGIERRDHFDLLEGLSAPAIVLAGDAVGPAPSVLDEGSLKRLAMWPGVSVRRIPGVGHAVWRGGSNEIVAAATELLNRAHDDDQDAASATSPTRRRSLSRTAAAARP
jgi:pimeloyl-ACP methyl ester carboxylesterase